MHDELVPELLLSLVWLVLLLAAISWCLARPSALSAAATLVAAAVWLPVNGPAEGPVLLVVTPSHGLTVADLLSAVALLAAIRAYRRIRT
ncbi:hypothetical protein M2280_004354 [Prescottella agglutinans]|uniref:Uncharacterized protein n=1 Tax=Prescottella agglutinans TaxID=1644129 RepID=A0ABT6MFL9_9NOCA|nr:hypothetical protein [Prescottella agglutinans]